MAGKATEFGIDVGKYAEKYPEMPSRTLARKIKQETGTKKSIDTIRQNLRYYRGTAGEKNRRQLHENHEQLAKMCKVPVTAHQSYNNYIFKQHYKSTLVLADIHVPYHDRKAVEQAIKFGKKRDPDSILLNGDILDAYYCSSFVQEPDAMSFKKEIKLLNQLLDYLQDQFPKAKIVYKMGNHEDRLARYIATNAPALWGMDCATLPVLVNAMSRGIDFVLDKRVIKYGKLSILHGHEWGRGFIQTVNPARTLFLRTKVTALAAHQHQSSQHTENDLHNQFVSCWSMGCLCFLHPKYRPINKWNHGFGLIEKDKTGNFSYENFKIIEGKVFAG